MHFPSYHQLSIQDHHIDIIIFRPQQHCHRLTPFLIAPCTPSNGPKNDAISPHPANPTLPWAAIIIDIQPWPTSLNLPPSLLLSPSTPLPLAGPILPPSHFLFPSPAMHTVRSTIPSITQLRPNALLLHFPAATLIPIAPLVLSPFKPPAGSHCSPSSAPPILHWPIPTLWATWHNHPFYQQFQGHF